MGSAGGAIARVPIIRHFRRAPDQSAPEAAQLSGTSKAAAAVPRCDGAPRKGRSAIGLAYTGLIIIREDFGLDLQSGPPDHERQSSAWPDKKARIYRCEDKLARGFFQHSKTTGEPLSASHHENFAYSCIPKRIITIRIDCTYAPSRCHLDVCTSLHIFAA